MLFTSITFLAFAFLFFPLYWLTYRSKWRNFVLVAGAYVFYGAGDWRRCGLLLFVSSVNYVAGWGIHHYPKYKRALLPVAISINLALLFSFKYVRWFLGTLGSFTFAQDSQWLQAASGHIAFLDYSMAIGLSFFCFQGLTYSIGVARRSVKYCRNFIDFLAFQSMFPVILAGPICRAETLLPQLRQSCIISNDLIWSGFRLIALGMFKKMAIADSLVPFVDQLFDAPLVSGSAWLWSFAILAFTIQIYCDFSGYSDIAIGLGRLLGFDFGINFNRPYLSTSFTEFWRRWHISLSTWFRDYVYIPLGGSRVGRTRAIVNLWATMVLSGLWHGAAWTYVAWGVYHGTILAFEKRFGLVDRKTPQPLLIRLLKWLGVMLLVAFGWLIFRARNMTQVLDVVQIMVRPDAWMPSLAIGQAHLPNTVLVMLVFILFGTIGILYERGRTMFPKRTALLIEQLACILLVILAIYLRGPGREFIYFQF